MSTAEWAEFSAKRFKEIPIDSFAGKEKWADKFMKANHEKLKINQLRNFFGEITAIKKDPTIWDEKETGRLKESLALLEMNMAWDYGRNVISKDFYNLITDSLDKITNEEDFRQFVVFVQSLIAYHKLHSNK